jgi:hypothetical protein
VILSLLTFLTNLSNASLYLRKDASLSNESKSLSTDLFLSSSKTYRLEWGCPVSEMVPAKNRAEALQKIEKECRAEVAREAELKPEVLDVLQTSVIWPDVNIKEADGGFYLHGTFFLETVVLQKAFYER